MKKLFIISSLTFCSLVFAQNLSKTEAKKAFKDSNIRKELGFKLSDFNYKKLVVKSKETRTNLSDMLILNKTKDAEYLNKLVSDYRRKDNVNGSFCIYCNLIPYSSLALKNYEALEPK